MGAQAEPQPDFALLRGHPLRYRDRLPGAQDVWLVIEIADSSLHFDREVKAPLYARAGLPEYWIINLAERQIEVHLDPDPAAGCYREIRSINRGTLAASAFPDAAISLTEVFD